MRRMLGKILEEQGSAAAAGCTLGRRSCTGSCLDTAAGNSSCKGFETEAGCWNHTACYICIDKFLKHY